MFKLKRTAVGRESSLRSRAQRLRIESLENRLTMAGDMLVGLSLRAVDLDGTVLTKLTVNHPFDLQIIAEDLRDDPQGIFAAYMDVLFPADLVEASGTFKPSSPFINAPKGTIGDGILDEVGSFSNSLIPLGGGEALIGSFRFTPTQAGLVEFKTDPADDLPFDDVLIYGLNVEVGSGEVSYGILTIDTQALRSMTLSLVAEGESAVELEAFDDSSKMLSDSEATAINVLNNDTIPAGSTVSIMSVSGAVGGTATVSLDQKSIIYKPSAGVIGTETLSYVVRDRAGNQSTARVHIDVASRFQNQSHAVDRDANGLLLPLDALIGINALNQRGPKKLEPSDLLVDGQTVFFDVNGDGFHSPIDELICINALNEGTVLSGGEGEASPLFLEATSVQNNAAAINAASTNAASTTTASVDAIFGVYPSSDGISDATTNGKRRTQR